MTKMTSPSQWVIISMLILLFSPTHLNSYQFKQPHANMINETSMEVKLYPLMNEKNIIMVNETRRKLGSYQICALCTCCGAKGYCLASPCCYAINCNIPNRPFGFCSFTPRACNCFACHL